MELIKWANNEGLTLVLTNEEAEDLAEVINKAIRYGQQEGTYFNIEIEKDWNEVK